ncbi:MAG TPA: acyl-CoA dehydrogenase family protein [Acidimicrobiales bacterium]|jgi:alkylation response protein AidB-like acyl-CoA dehydrogenase|nr:acyl-CoA dehydrogenase family protein [Acidimicrobiales bacterium]
MTTAVDADPVAEFRAELVAWLAEHLTGAVIEAGRAGMDVGDNFEILRAWNQTLADAGWAAVAWPREFGGREAGIAEQLACLEEMSAAEAPGAINVIGVSNIAPAIMAVGTEEQQARFLAPMLRGDEIWSQGMSEPDAGSDLASLRTSARLEGDVFVVNGQKTWNSLGRHADWCQLYVRTDADAPKHKGISCLLVDMTTPGVEVRPLRTMAGELTFSELFFTDVEVPRERLLGPLNEGWRVAMTTLSHERAGVARLHLSLSNRLDKLMADAKGRAALSDPVIRDRLMALYARIACMRWTTTRELQAVGQGRQPSPTMGSIAKLMWSLTEQTLAELAVDLLGLEALSGPWAKNLASSRQSTIAGGTTEINRNILGEHGLGLPR